MFSPEKFFKQQMTSVGLSVILLFLLCIQAVIRLFLLRETCEYIDVSPFWKTTQLRSQIQPWDLTQSETEKYFESIIITKRKSTPVYIVTNGKHGSLMRRVQRLLGDELLFNFGAKLKWLFLSLLEKINLRISCILILKRG